MAFFCYNYIIMVDEVRELENNPSFYTQSDKKEHKKRKLFGSSTASPLILILLGIIGIAIYSVISDEQIPEHITHNLNAATDTQCANGTIDKEWVFIESLRTGSLPSDTIKNLNKKDIQIGILDAEGNFTESKNGTILKKDNQYLSGTELYDEFQNDTDLYAALNSATYSCAAYYYDQSAEEVFENIGTSRNNYSENTNFTDIINSAFKNTSNININSVSTEERTVINEETNQEETITVYAENGSSIQPKQLSAEEIIQNSIKKFPANSTTEANLNVATTLNIADTAIKDQQSAKFAALIHESISKMKAGESASSNLTDVMNFLYTKTTTEYVDPITAEIKTVTGAPIDSPTLKAILADNPVSSINAAAYSSDRILETTKGQLNLSFASEDPVNNSVFDAITSTVASFTKNIRGSISRFLASGTTTAEFAVLAPIIPTISSSIIQTSFLDSISGIAAGEYLVEGTANINRKLAISGSGATAGDSNAILSYNKENNRIANLNAEVDRRTLSPFDISSPNTFLGSIVSKFIPKHGQATNIISTAASSLQALLPTTYAAGENENYLTTFGTCNTLSTINASGSIYCSPIASFDTSTQYDPYNNPEFQKFVNANTYLDKSGNRVIREGSYLANFILYNDDRESPLGVNDASILSSLRSNSAILNFFADIAESIGFFKEANAEQKAIASGSAFTNSASNPYWDQYKYAQRYVSVNRTLNILKQYSSDPTAYNNLQFFEGSTDSVLAFRENYYATHPRDNSFEGYLARISGYSKDTISLALSQLNYIGFLNNYHPDTKLDFAPELDTSIERLNTSDDNLVILEILHEATTARFIELGENIIKQNYWTLV